MCEAQSHSCLAYSDGLRNAPSPVSFPCFSTGPSHIQGGVELVRAGGLGLGISWLIIGHTPQPGDI